MEVIIIDLLCSMGGSEGLGGMWDVDLGAILGTSVSLGCDMFILYHYGACDGADWLTLDAHCTAC